MEKISNNENNSGKSLGLPGADSNLLIKEQFFAPSSASLTDEATGDIVDANTTATAIGMTRGGRRSLTEYRVVAKPSINRSSSLSLDGHNDEAVSSPPSLRDAFRNSKRLSISESTRRLLESMDESQVRHAEVSLSAVKQLRSGILKDNVENDNKDEHQEGNDGEKARAIDDIVSQMTISEPNSQPDDEWEPPSLNFAKPLGRRKRTEAMSCTGIIQNTTFKPISSSTVNYDYFNDLESDDDNDDKRKSNPGETNGWGLGGIWNKLTSKNASEGGISGESILEKMVDADGTGITKKASPIAKSKKRIDVSGGTKASAPYDYYICRGKKKAGKGEYLQAVALYNLALIRQRDDLGVDHIDCATTLNEIGICWMMLSERYLALSAYEESLYIRQKHLGDGAMEVAETTNNIWMILHEERCEIMEKEVNGEVIPGVEGGGDVNSTNDVENQDK